MVFKNIKNIEKSIEKIRFYPRFALAIRVIRVPFDLNSYQSCFKIYNFHLKKLIVPKIKIKT